MVPPLIQLPAHIVLKPCSPAPLWPGHKRSASSHTTLKSESTYQDAPLLQTANTNVSYHGYRWTSVVMYRVKTHFSVLLCPRTHLKYNLIVDHDHWPQLDMFVFGTRKQWSSITEVFEMILSLSSCRTTECPGNSCFINIHSLWLEQLPERVTGRRSITSCVGPQLGTHTHTADGGKESVCLLQAACWKHTRRKMVTEVAKLQRSTCLIQSGFRWHRSHYASAQEHLT